VNCYASVAAFGRWLWLGHRGLKTLPASELTDLF